MAENQLRILVGMHRIVNEMDRETSHIAKEYDLTIGQFAVLEALFNKGDLSVGEVQEKILSTSGTIPVIVRNLMKRDLITQKSDERDKRRVILSLTDTGRKIIEQVYPRNVEGIKAIVDRLTPKEQEQLVSLLRKFHK